MMDAYLIRIKGTDLFLHKAWTYRKEVKTGEMIDAASFPDPLNAHAAAAAVLDALDADLEIVQIG